MIIVSKTQLKVKQIHDRREDALEKLKQAAKEGKGLAAAAKALADVETELAQAELEPNVYDCAQCGKEFSDGRHVDLLVAAVVTYQDDGTAENRDDFGYGDPRRIKVCGACHSTWAIKANAYIHIR